MKFTVLGYGKIGKTIVHDLSTHAGNASISVYDPLGRFPEKHPANVSFHMQDPLDPAIQGDVFRDDRVIISALPARLRAELFELAERNHCKLVDISFGNDIISPEKLKGEKGFLIVPDAGLAPGLTNLLVGRFTKEMDRVDLVKIYVGGVPDTPLPPLEYKLVFAMDSVIDEYVNPCSIVVDGAMMEVQALSGLENIEFDGKEYEAFYTDGLRTLIHTIKPVGTMFEKTVRYKGHSEKIRLLRDLGYLSAEKVNVGGMEISPREVSEKVLEKALKNQDVGDIVLFRVSVTGMKNGIKKTVSASMIDHSTAGESLTSMGRTTAFPASIIAQLIANGKIDNSGYAPMELLGMDEQVFEVITDELRMRNISITMDQPA